LYNEIKFEENIDEVGASLLEGKVFEQLSE